MKKEQFDAIMARFDKIDSRQDSFDSRLIALEKGKSTAVSSSPKKKATSAKKETPKPATKAEAIEAWKKAKYTDKQRAAFGKAAAEVRAEMMAENAAMKEACKASNDWSKYLKGDRWNAEFKARMAKRGFKMSK